MNGGHKRFVLCIGNAIDEKSHLSQTIKDIDPEIAIVKVSAGREAARFLKNAQDVRIVPSLIIIDMVAEENNSAATLGEIQNDPALKSVPLVILENSGRSVGEFTSTEVRLVADPQQFDLVTEAIKQVLIRDGDKLRNEGR